MSTALVNLRMQKRALRKAISNKLSSLSLPALDQQSQAVVSRVLSLPSFQKSSSIGCYLSMPSSEVDTSSLAAEILGRGKTLFVPKIHSMEGSMELLKVYDTEDLRSLPSGVWGIKEPQSEWQGATRLSAMDEDFNGLDVVLVPGVAFDESLSRLGHGKGYYDRFLTTYMSTGRPRPLLVALALREQVLEGQAIPVGDHDWKMDLIVTADKVFGQVPSFGNNMIN